VSVQQWQVRRKKPFMGRHLL